MQPPTASSLLKSHLQDPSSSSSSIIKSRSQAQQLHAHLLKSSPPSSSSSSIVTIYSSLGLVHEAQLAFSSLPSPSPSPLSYKAIIRCSSSHSLYDQVFSLFVRMRASGLTPDHNTFPSVLKSCAALSDHKLGESLQGCVVRLSLDSDLYTGNAVMNLYSKLGRFPNERNLFDELPKSRLTGGNVPMDRVRRVFGEMPEKDVVSLNTMIVASAENGLYEEALSLVREMGTVGLKPDSFTLSIVLPIFVEFVDVSKGMEIHGYAMRHGFDSDVFMGSSLVDMCENCARAEYCLCVFHLLPNPDAITWNSLSRGVCRMGCLMSS